MIHCVAAAAVAVVFLCTLLPFFPGAYDPLALPLSMMARFGAIAALLLVPVGFTAAFRSFAATAIIVATLVWLFVSLLAWMNSTALGAITAVVGFIVVARMIRRWRQPSGGAAPTRAIGLYFVVLPIAVVGLQWVVVPRAVEFSRNRAIRNCESLIADIEQYRTTNGRYPLSLQALWPDYKPSVMGVERYHYEPSGESYNVFFENPALSFGTREIVMYNPRDEQQFTSHPMDLLQYPLERLNRARGHYASGDAAHPHWKYFWFD
jgi:hypothetical protein